MPQGVEHETAELHSLLLVEDNPADVKIMQRALTQTASRIELVVVADGQEAVDYLLRQGKYARREAVAGKGGKKEGTAWRRPDLIVLDLNLPRLTGIEVLRQIRAVDHLCLTPVVVLSTSRQPEDVCAAYAAGANTYIEKPYDFDRFVEIMRTILQFWLEMAVLPRS
jgi:two-component system response regulator